MRMWQGAFGLVPTDGIVSPAYVVLTPIPEKVISHFFEYYFKRGRQIHNFWAYSQGLTEDRLRLYFDDFKVIRNHVPELKEQTKIASFLTAIDDKIAQLTQKHVLLNKYKKGMMQQIFSQQLRFNDDEGREFAEWEERKLEEITKSISAGATPSTGKEKYWNGKIKWMSSGELNLRHVYDVEKSITELGYKSSSTKLLPKFCVLIGLAGQGKTRGTVAINHIELCTNQSIAAIHPNNEVFDYRYLYFNLDMRYEELRALSKGDGGRGGLNLQIIRDIPVYLPSLPEQTKIANFLSSIDQKMQQVAAQLEAVKQYKRGLLQQMFV
jgi:type I restriction enzyme S subunit